MKETKMLKLLVFIVSFVIVTSPFLYCQEIKLIENIPVSQIDCLLEVVDGFVVLPGGSFIICDTQAGNFKIFDKRGSLLKIFGRRGSGPDEFSVPKLLDYSDSKLIINDWDKNRLLIYQINNELELKKIDEFSGICFDAKIQSDRYLLAGTKVDKNGLWHLVYMEKPEQREYSYLLTREEIFNLPPKDSLVSNRNKLQERVIIGGRAYCDFYENSVFAIWEGMLSVVKVDMATMKKTRFGENTHLYKAPEVNSELIRTRKEKKLNEYMKELGKYSMIRKIFATNKYIGVVYMNYNKMTDMLNPVVQLYSTSGEFITEKKLEESSYPQYLMPLYYDKALNELNALSMMIDEKSEPHYTLMKYRIQ